MNAKAIISRTLAYSSFAVENQEAALKADLRALFSAQCRSDQRDRARSAINGATPDQADEMRRYCRRFVRGNVDSVDREFADIRES